MIENIVGAGGTTASTRAMRAAPDGYTIIMGHMGTHAASVALSPNLAYKPMSTLSRPAWRPARRF
jgi:tripartite-type tricarboxylate transporter receptor subunit TctC